MTLFFIIWIILLVIGMPITFAIICACLIYMFQHGGIMLCAQRLVAGVDSYTLLAVPFFIFSGNLMNATGITDRIFTFAKTCVGHIPGGLGHVNVLASLLFSGMSGSAHADAGGLGQIEIQAMREEGFDDGFSGAITAASSVVGPLMPPSIPLVIYGAIASVSVGKLFLGGVFPAILVSISLMIYVYFYAKKRHYKTYPKSTFSERWNAFVKAFPALLTPIIIIGGIFSGIFTPTEAAAVTSFYALILGIFVYKTFSLSVMRKVLKDTLSNAAVIGFLTAAISLMGYVLAREQIPQKIAMFFLRYTSNPIVFLLAVDLLLVILGCVIETMAIQLLVIPMLVPVAIALGIDPVHFGVVVTMNMMIGILTPPMGVSLFVVSKISGIPFKTLAKSILPMFIPLTIVLLLLIFFPQIVMFLPNLMR
ncbi:TRAP transporter large permease [Treponema socranskii]|uniref:TRAP transporter, DctM subunit n=1 Tax=Treponema socranskii subsp. socranskii VPI DR56BR1116 = ATCC 35536 TaxID=1125725 RepID=U2LB17_TRESO|nr:TRAP transporter large permease [Treponema socranskii]ERF59699.1 TRAP transporter, DctM subunit [Treponema socranskii subsp. socranskii VPI DR56BR1116 = ATCC 35536]ERK01506.1 TRAP transporter, DctM subunit [Treponema socranskii subsp. socranskii VPI DR56BR1116 = ATCC 35536]MDR9858990.1 TRAP transporter large permease [Treponema socranskii]